uniref:putative serpin A13 isoform X1 n=1 Tax=Urocitellus parryii TaxID=9999 RepID=UPI000E5597D9|nr:putative serpin A13 isoform X1 [Urocitellus parryii]
MEASGWWPLVTVLVAATPLLAQGDSELTDRGPQVSPPRPALPCHRISVSNIDFAFGLYRRLALDAPGENLLFSPASISLALATVSLGAPAASRTQLLEGLGFNLTVMSQAEIQEGVQDLLLRLPTRDSHLLLTTGQRSFRSLGPGATQKHIKEYVEEQTQGRLGAWVEDLGEEAAEVLVNHVALRAEWAQPFDPGATSLREFFLDERRAVQVPMVKQKASHRFLHDPELQCTVLQMDHAGNATTFFVFPNRGQLGQVEEALLPETLIKWDSLLRTRELDFYFPKFSISSTTRLEMLLPRVPVGGGLPGQPGLGISRDRGFAAPSHTTATPWAKTRALSAAGSGQARPQKGMKGDPQSQPPAREEAEGRAGGWGRVTASPPHLPVAFSRTFTRPSPSLVPHQHPPVDR